MFKELFSRSGLSLDRLQSFFKVAETESFTRAANGDSNRQTLFSRQIKELEEYFGVELFQRKGRTVALTEKGHELYALLFEYFAVFEDFLESCDSDFGSYVIGAGDSLIQWSLLPRLPELQKRFGRADLLFKNLRTKQIVEMLERGEIDFGLVRSDAVTSRLTAVEALSLEYVLFHPKNLEECFPDEATLLSDLSFVGMEGEGNYQSHLRQMAFSMGVMMKFSVRCSSFPMMAHAVQKLGLAAIMPRIAVEELPLEKYCQISFKELDPLKRRLSVCWNSRRAKLNPDIANLGNSVAELVQYQ